MDTEDTDNPETFRRNVDIDRLLQGQGWDNAEQDPDYFDDPRVDVNELEDAPDHFECNCDLDELYRVATSLAAFLHNEPNLIPRSMEQVESFAALGGYAHGPWSLMIDVRRSSPVVENGSGRLLIAGCGNVQHWISVGIDSARNITVKADQFGLTEHIGLLARSVKIGAAEPSDLSGNVEYVDLKDDFDEQEEDSYDERNYGHLEVEIDDVDEIDTGEFFDWQEAALPSTAIVEYRNAGLSLEDVIQLSRHIPLEHVVDWVQAFGKQSMTALEILKVGLGEVSRAPKLENVDLGELRDLAARVLRDGILVVLDQIKDRLPYESE